MAPLLSLQEACRVLSISETTGYKLAGSSSFPVEVINLGRKKFVRRSDLETFVGGPISGPEGNVTNGKSWTCPHCGQHFRRQGRHLLLHPEET